MVKLRYTLLLLIVLPSLIMAACSGSGGSASAGNAQHGQQLFNRTTIGPNAAPGCKTCHSLEPGKTLVGPSLAGIASQAANYVESKDYTGSAKTVQGFLRESIVSPNAFITPGFSEGEMYQNYGQDLSEQEINDLVAFMMTLK
jgi:cytochrome c2